MSPVQDHWLTLGGTSWCQWDHSAFQFGGLCRGQGHDDTPGSSDPDGSTTSMSSRREHVAPSSDTALDPSVPTRGKPALLSLVKTFPLWHQSTDSQHQSTEMKDTTPPWSPQEDSSLELEVEPCHNQGATTQTCPTFHQISVQTSPLLPSNCPGGQWPMQVQGPPSSHSYSLVSERRAPPPQHLAPNPDSCTEPSTNRQDLGLGDVVRPEEEGGGPCQYRPLPCSPQKKLSRNQVARRHRTTLELTRSY